MNKVTTVTVRMHASIKEKIMVLAALSAAQLHYIDCVQKCSFNEKYIRSTVLHYCSNQGQGCYTNKFHCTTCQDPTFVVFFPLKVESFLSYMG